MAQLNFDATRVAPEMGFDTVPAGWYNAMIDQSEMKPTKDGAGAYLETRFNVIDGQYAGRKVFMRMNLRNASPVAQEIAYKQLSAVAHAVGILHVQDSSQLHGIPMKIKVKLRKDATGQYEDSNEITQVKNINEQVDMPQGSAQPNFGAAPQGFGAQAAPSAPPQSFAPPQQAFAAPQAAPQPWQQPAAPQAPAAAPGAPAPWQNQAMPPAAPPAGAPAPWMPPAGNPAGAPAANPQTAPPPWQQG